VDPTGTLKSRFEFQNFARCVSFILSVVFSRCGCWGSTTPTTQPNPTTAINTMAIGSFDRCLLATGYMSLMLTSTVVSLVVVFPPPPPLPPVAIERNGWILGRPSSYSLLNDGATAWLRTTTTTTTSSIFVANEPEPSSDDIILLRQAFSESNARNYDSAVKLFDTVIMKWVDQPVDERAALYRSRADCYMSLGDASAAYADYDACLKLLQKDNIGAADPAELPTALLGRARAGLAGGTDGSSAKKKKNAMQQIAADYQQALLLLGTDEYDDEQTEMEVLSAAAKQNPYAMWEYGAALRNAGQANGEIRMLAATAFATIGDPARSVITQIDAGIDYAARGDIPSAESTLAKAIAQTVGVESRDVRLLQRVITKEGEGRLALAALYWSDNQKAQAETVLGDACVRLDQLSNQMDGAAAATTSSVRPANNNKLLRFSIDDNDDALVGSLTCARFKNKDFLTNVLKWPESLQDQVLNLQLVQQQR
jgi:tetratricopeptide (TPR) repeat protein